VPGVGVAGGKGSVANVAKVFSFTFFGRTDIWIFKHGAERNNLKKKYFKMKLIYFYGNNYFRLPALVLTHFFLLGTVISFPSQLQGRSKQFLCFGPELKLAPQIFFFFFFKKMRPHFLKRRPHRAILRPSYSSFQGGGGCKRGLFGLIGAPFHTALRAAAPVAPPLLRPCSIVQGGPGRVLFVFFTYTYPNSSQKV
jgi:hypothetical protein